MLSSVNTVPLKTMLEVSTGASTTGARGGTEPLRLKRCVARRPVDIPCRSPGEGGSP